MKTNLKLSLLIPILFMACSTSFEIKKHFNEENPEYYTFSSSPIEVKASSPTEYKYYRVFIELLYVNQEDVEKYNFKIKYLGSRLIYFSKIELNIAGEVTFIESDRIPLRRQEGVQGVAEIINVTVTEQKIEDMLTMRDTEITLIGELDKIEFPLQEEFYKALSRFYKETKTN